MSLAGQLQNVRWWVRACGIGRKKCSEEKLGTRALVASRDERAVTPPRTFSQW